MQSTITEDVSAVGRISQVLEEKIGSQRFKIWFQNSTRLTLTEEFLKVTVPNQFVSSWIESHFTVQINNAVRAATGNPCKIVYTIDPQLAGHNRAGELSPPARLPEGTGQTGLQNRPMSRPSDGKGLKFSLDNYVVGRCNELAFNAARTIINQDKSSFNPLFVHGGYGVGKTHLLQGICNAVRNSRPQTNWLYLSAEDFANQFVLALKTKKLEAFRSRIRQTELLAIDDIHFLASKQATQEEFLHTFNTIDLAGKQILLASDAHPKQIEQISDKLVSRFVSGMVVKIEPPDLAVRSKICRQFAESMGNQISEAVIRYVAENLRSNVRELEGAMLKLFAYAALQGEKMTLAMAQNVLGEHLARTDPMVHVSEIESAVATYFGITVTELRSPKKNKTIALARHFSMYLARKHTRMSFSEIGKFLGNKNHATVLLACKKIEDDIRANSELNWLSPVGNRVCKACAIVASLEGAIAG